MELEKSLVVGASPDAVWALLLDPQAMAACVPGTRSVEVLGPDEYRSRVQVKVAFISPTFGIRTRIVERDAPRYLKAEGSGDDVEGGSSFRQTSEIWLADADGGGTALRMKLRVDLRGRLATFGLSAVKTKADRMWDEFGRNLAGRIEAGAAVSAPEAAAAVPALPPTTPSPVAEPAPLGPQGEPLTMPPPAVSSAPGRSATVQAAPGVDRLSWWRRWFARSATIRVVVVRGATRIEAEWPSDCSEACLSWLREVDRTAA